tara:strand:- start:628 stop:759 length:132 start_codon:yes stop_codon:yes gene_type:complete
MTSFGFIFYSITIFLTGVFTGVVFKEMINDFITNKKEGDTNEK